MDLLVIGLIVILAIQLLYFFFKGETSSLTPIISQIPTPEKLVGSIIGGSSNIPKQAVAIAAKTTAHNLKAIVNQNTLKNIIDCKNLISDLL